ncbi:substrate-binding domain-containing protein [Bradyrhizobium sp. Ce-3]|uniref:substrate-binding domain-containing protein n=1 Tax=Bradyrhizobium sp. Ce-3 TaxID=2913970 RepID=UPI001FC8A4F2|nr:substrate-binding domain-containing protein [Bradyrhizobium sp. Ce-3]GKQ55135.1 nitrile hydratase regulator [Bradyrhizobium sp. Ce-3]
MLTSFKLTRRNFVRAASAGALAIGAPAILRPAMAADVLKIGVLVADSGPAALFGPAQRAAAELGAATVNAKGGILGRQVAIVFADAGASPAEVAKSAVKLMLSDKVEMIFGSHDSAVRQGVENVVKGKLPYVYTPVFEGDDCSPNVYFLGEVPEQELQKTLPKLLEFAKGKTFYLVGNDYVWARTTNEKAKKYIGEIGGKVVAEDYYPLGAPNKFENTVAKIKAEKPSVVLQTLVGGDNVNFNRTFADFNLSDDIVRLSCLLEENTLMGIGKDASKNLYSSLGYFADIDLPENKTFIGELAKKYGDKAPQQCTISKGLYDAFIFASAVAAKSKSLGAKEFAAAAEGISFETPSGPMTMTKRHTTKNIFLARCDGTKFTVIDTFSAVPTQQSCT